MTLPYISFKFLLSQDTSNAANRTYDCGVIVAHIQSILYLQIYLVLGRILYNKTHIYTSGMSGFHRY